MKRIEEMTLKEKDILLKAIIREYQLLENDYLHPSYKDWWLEFYSRSTYYRLRRKMLDEVLFYLTR